MEWLNTNIKPYVDIVTYLLINRAYRVNKVQVWHFSSKLTYAQTTCKGVSMFSFPLIWKFASYLWGYACLPVLCVQVCMHVWVFGEIFNILVLYKLVTEDWNCLVLWLVLQAY